MNERQLEDEFAASRAREILGDTQHKLWGAMYYVRNADVGISETQLKRAIRCIEKLQSQLNPSAERSEATK